MTFQEALRASYDSEGELGARCSEHPDLGVLRWAPFLGWVWHDPAIRPMLPSPQLVFADWDTVECPKS